MQPRAEHEQIAELLRTSKCAVALTGAGISADSGLATFRGADGLWKGHDPVKLATVGALARAPELVWEFYGLRIERLAEVGPNPAHAVLAELERRDLLQGVITQNVDGLHRAAGSKRIFELHGTLATVSCTACRFELPATERNAHLDERGLPSCPQCGSLLRPDVVFFGEGLTEALDPAVELAERADLLLCIGSSLVVEPAASITNIVAGRGGKVVMLNPEPTGRDGLADWRLRAGASADLQAILACL